MQQKAPSLRRPSRQAQARRHRVLDAAVETFVRYGYRRTSMEEVARAAQVSRQALYLHFPSKDDLFHAAVRHAVTTGLAKAEAALAAPGPLIERIAGAFDAWVGQHAGLTQGGIESVEAEAAQVVGPIIPEFEERFIAAVAKQIGTVALPSGYRARRISARQVAEVLTAAAHGFKSVSRSPYDFHQRFRVAVRALLLPLGDSGG